MTTRTRLALVSLLTVAFVACSGDSSGPPAVATVNVPALAGNVIVGQTAQLTATAKDAKGNTLTNRKVAWTTSSQAIATVSNAGVVTGVSPGGATITATIEGKTGTATVTIVAPPVATVTVTATATTLQAGQTTQATAVTRDASNTVVTGRTVTWSTSDQAIATVSGAGVVTAVAGGTATITATSEAKTGTVQVTVIAGNPADAPQIATITPSTLVEGQPATITGTKFGATADANVVRIGGVTASVTAATPTSLQIVVPNQNCKPAQNINVDVTVGGNGSLPKSQPFTPSATPFTLAQGQQRLIASPSDFCLQFPATSTAETYLIGLQSVSQSAASLTPAVVTGEAPTGAIVSQVSIATAPVFSAPLIDPLAARNDRMAQHRVAHAAFLAQDRADLVARFASGRAKLATRSARAAASRASASQAPTVPATAKVGDVINMRVPTRPNTCLLSTPITVTVKAVGQHGIFVEDNANPTGGFSAADYQTLSARFDNEIYAVDVGYFGDPTDFDENTRVVIVITREVNKVTPTILGQVIFADLASRDECPASNEGEYFYGRAPDPNASVGSAYTVANALLDAPIIIAHEFTHVIQIGRRGTYEAATDFQSQWEIEGQATFAEEVNGFQATGRSPGQNLGFAVMWNDPKLTPIDWFKDGWIDLLYYYGVQTSTTRVRNAPEQCSWLAQPSSSGNSGPCVGGRDVYGVPYTLLRWISDQYGPTFPGGEKGLHRKLIDNAFTGYATLSDVTGTPIDVLLARWAAALYVDDRVPGIDPKLTFTSWNLTNIEAGLIPVTHLLPRDRPFGAFSDQIAVRGGSTAYFLVSGAGRPATGIRMRDLSDGTLPSVMRLWVVRTQ